MRRMIHDRYAFWSVRFFVRLSIALMAFSCFGILSAEAGDRIVKVGVYENAPKIFTAESGKPAGIFIEIIEHIAKIEGWTLRYVPGTFGEGLDRLAKGEIDLMPDVAYSAEREGVYSFHKVPVLTSWFQVFAPTGSGIRSIVDLNGKRILVLDRSVQHTAFIRLSTAFGVRSDIITVPDYKTMFEAVAKGEADAAVTNTYYGIRHAKKYGLEDTAVVFEPSELFFAAQENAPRQVLDRIDKHLFALKKDHQSMYYASLKRWTSEDLRFKLPAWLQIMGLMVGLALVMSVAGGFVLKHQVNVRTRELKQINQEMECRIAERTAELAAVNDEQRTVFESAGAGIVFLRDRVIVRCNRKAEEIGGWAPGELIGKSTRIWYPDDESYVTGRKKVYAQLATGETYRQEHQVVRKNGSVFWARLSLRAVDKDAPIKGAVAIVEDITAEHDAAEKLVNAMEAAQAADRIKSAFLATMSHELRTPLNSIIGFTGILLQGLAGPLNQEQQKQLTMVQSSSRHLLALINDVLDISKIEAGELVLFPEPFTLRQFLEKTVKMISPLAKKKGIDLRLDISDAVGTITTDQRRLEQVVLNLLNNAVKFTEKGHVSISCRMENDHYLLSFSDSGVGMRPEDVPDIFQPFRQIDSGLTRKHEGTGLGLSICRKIIDMMGGSISVESRWGEGSTFTVRLPGQSGGSS